MVDDQIGDDWQTCSTNHRIMAGGPMPHYVYAVSDSDSGCDAEMCYGLRLSSLRKG